MSLLIGANKLNQGLGTKGYYITIEKKCQVEKTKICIMTSSATYAFPISAPKNIPFISSLFKH